MTNSTIQYNPSRKYHKPMRAFLRTQGPFVKSAYIIGLWMQHILAKLFFERMLEEFPDQYAEPVDVWISTERSYHVR